jgi:hypothetical protein
MSCTNFLVSLSSSSSGGWLKWTWSDNQGIFGNLVPDAIIIPGGSQTVLPSKLTQAHLSPGASGQLYPLPFGHPHPLDL